MQRQVSEAIKREKPASILVLGTSEEMVDKIIERLGLPAVPPESPRRIRIEEITTEDERIAAHRQRNEYGKHVIPAPSLQLKRTFAGYFMDPLRFFRGKDQGASSERTVVRPAYSYLGEYLSLIHISEPLVTGGGTYARATGGIVAYGALFPGDEDVMHQKDEYIEIEKLELMTKIYAEAIYKLSSEDYNG